MFEESYTKLIDAGIKVTRRVLRDEGAKVLSDYGKSGVIYNG